MIMENEPIVKVVGLSNCSRFAWSNFLLLRRAGEQVHGNADLMPDYDIGPYRVYSPQEPEGDKKVIVQLMERCAVPDLENRIIRQSAAMVFIVANAVIVRISSLCSGYLPTK